MNLTIILGNICSDIDFKYTNSNKPMAKFSVAVNRKFKKEETDFFNCTAFGKTAEFINNYFGKGRKIAVTGRMESNKYEEKTYWNLIVDEVDFADSKKSGTTTEFKEVKDDDDEMPF